MGPTIALWGARKPSQVETVGNIVGCHIDKEAKKEIDAILRRTIPEPVSPAFMAPPDKRSAGCDGEVRSARYPRSE